MKQRRGCAGAQAILSAAYSREYPHDIILPQRRLHALL
jgi:hypothetical protein